MANTSMTERTVSGTRALAWAVLVAAILEVVAPVITATGPGSSPGEGSGPELLITPVGWAFSIWGVIYTLAIVHAVATLVRGPAGVPRRLQIDLVVLYLGGAVWIVLAGLDSSLATAAMLLVMLVAAVDGVLTAARTPVQHDWFGVLTRVTVGLYAGWVTAAAFLNVSTALVDAGAVKADSSGWQLAVVVAAVAFLLVVLVATRGNRAYAAAGTWAMVGIAVTGSANDDTSVVMLAVVAGVLLVGTAAALRYAHGEQWNRSHAGLVD